MHEKTKEALIFQALSSRSKAVFSMVGLPQTILEKIHYSWLIPIFQKFPKNERSSFFSILPENQAKGLSKLMDESLQRLPLTPPAHHFFISILYKQLDVQHIVPISLLPESEFKEMASWSKQKLIELINFLGLYDLAKEMRTIVDNRILKEIYNSLSLKKQLYLKSCLMQKERLVGLKLDLAKYQGNSKKLLLALHRRGLIRLGRALSHESPFLLWHLSRTLDNSRGTFLLKCATSNKIAPQALKYLKQQVKDVLHFLEKNRIDS